MMNWFCTVCNVTNGSTHVGSFLFYYTFFFFLVNSSWWMLITAIIFIALAIPANRLKERKEALRYCLSIMLNNHRCLVRDEALNLSRTASCFYLHTCHCALLWKEWKRKKSAIPSAHSCSFEFQSGAYRIGVDLEWLCATATVQIYRHSILLCFWHTVTVRKRHVDLSANRLPGEKSFFSTFPPDMVHLCQLYSVSKIHFKIEYERNHLETWHVAQRSLTLAPPSHFAFSHLGPGGGRSCLMKCKPRMPSLTRWSCAQSDGNLMWIWGLGHWTFPGISPLDQILCV